MLRKNKKVFNALILTQSIPQNTGNGTAIRLGLAAQALSEIYNVTLCIATQDPNNTVEKIPNSILQYFNKVAYAYSPYKSMYRSIETSFWQPRMQRRWPTTDIAGQLNSISFQEFDLVYVVRLCMLPVWETIAEIQNITTKHTILDLDDIESRACFRNLLTQRFKLGYFGLFRELFEVIKLRNAENLACKLVDLTLVCSSADESILSKRIPASRLATLPNAARTPDQLLDTKYDKNKTLRILLVGSLDYLPNAEAARWAIEKLAPAFRSRFGNRFRLSIVGRRPPEWLNNLDLPSDVEVFADAPELESHYASSFAVIAPIRSGGGTRIKILEAFGYGRPVISTEIGAEGIDYINGTHLMLAETEIDFLNSVSRLESHPSLYESMIYAAHQLFINKYSPEAFINNMTTTLNKLPNHSKE
jgi:glycosyltransferase involved in cell wall biosynthesis